MNGVQEDRTALSHPMKSQIIEQPEVPISMNGRGGERVIQEEEPAAVKVK